MLTCSSHISCEAIWVRFSCRGVRAAEKISEVGFLYEDPGRHAQPHTNHKPVNLHLTEHRKINLLQI